MEVKDFVEILKNWSTKNDIINSTYCEAGCENCELNNKILIGREFNTICTIICKINKELNSI